MLTRRTSDNDYTLSSPNGSEEAHNYMLKEYPLPKCEHNITHERIKGIGRLIWYCNTSGELIPSLNNIIGREVNSEDGNDEYDDITNNLGSYRVYPCGHAFYNNMLHEFLYSISLASWGWYSKGSHNGGFRANIRLLDFVKALEKTSKYCPLCDDQTFTFTNINQSIYNIDFAKELEKTSKYCPLCNDQTFTFKNVTQSERINMYNIDSGQGGTIVSARRIPKKYLTYIGQEFKKGDIVDTEGYRGIGLYIFNGNWI